MNESTTIALRLEKPLVALLEEMARGEGLEPAAYIQRLVRLHVADSGLMPEAERDRIQLTESLMTRAVTMALKLDAEGLFDAHFTLTVINALFCDSAFLVDYERAIGGPALSRGLAAKASLNMNLGWQIKAAVCANPLLDAKGKARRVQVRNRPIQSYTLLTRVG
jgi:hypothetical protein